MFEGGLGGCKQQSSVVERASTVISRDCLYQPPGQAEAVQSRQGGVKMESIIDNDRVTTRCYAVAVIGCARVQSFEEKTCCGCEREDGGGQSEDVYSAWMQGVSPFFETRFVLH